MRLSDIMGNMGLQSYAEVGLVIFLACFVLIAVRLFFFSKPSDITEASQLPLDEVVHPARNSASASEARP
jgi:hypothetical protein